MIFFSVIIYEPFYNREIPFLTPWSISLLLSSPSSLVITGMFFSSFSLLTWYQSHYWEATLRLLLALCSLPFFLVLFLFHLPSKIHSFTPIVPYMFLLNPSISVASVIPTTTSSITKPLFPFSLNINSIFQVPMEKTKYVNWKSMFLSTLNIYKLAPIILEPEIGSLSTSLFSCGSNPLCHLLSKHRSSIALQLGKLGTAWTTTLPLFVIYMLSLSGTSCVLQSTHHRCLSMEEYLIFMMNTADSLATAGTVIPYEDLVNNVVDELQSSYKTFMTTLPMHLSCDI